MTYEFIRESIGNLVGHFVSIAAALDWIQWLFIGSMIALGALLIHCQRSSDEFDLRHLITDTETGKVDRFAFMYVVGGMFFGWFFLMYSTAGKMTEAYALIVAVYWAAPKSIAEFVKARAP